LEWNEDADPVAFSTTAPISCHSCNCDDGECRRQDMTRSLEGACQNFNDNLVPTGDFDTHYLLRGPRRFHPASRF
jgi:hypothetical protein